MISYRKPSEELDYGDFFDRFSLVDFADKMNEFMEV
jgi:hypothetical protein|tara:strand:- start:368 stop:475 length:108 start_codon:yes stop_codon:yes gene_type:complete